MEISGHCCSSVLQQEMLCMRDHLANALRNAMYTSPDVQNQVIDILGTHVREKILLREKIPPKGETGTAFYRHS